MGTREVYDYKLQKWVPYVSDPDKWYQHLIDLRDGLVQPDHLGRYIVGSGAKYRHLKEMETEQIEKHRSVVNLVSPVAQAMEMARSEQGHVKLDFVLWNIKGSMSCTDTPFNESSVIII